MLSSDLRYETQKCDFIYMFMGQAAAYGPNYRFTSRFSSSKNQNLSIHCHSHVCQTHQVTES